MVKTFPYRCVQLSRELLFKQLPTQRLSTSGPPQYSCQFGTGRLLQLSRKTAHPNNFRLNTALSWVLSNNTPADSESHRANGG